MLVLTRKQGETIRVADDITIKVIKTGKGTVKIGIDAPGHVKVLRGELNERLEAAAVPFQDVSQQPQDVSEQSLAVDLVGYFPFPQTA